jgi:hypothetical protein
MKEEMVKAEIKVLYRKDKNLAHEVAKALGYKIQAATKKKKTGKATPKGMAAPKKAAAPKKTTVPNKVEAPKVKKGGGAKKKGKKT